MTQHIPWIEFVSEKNRTEIQKLRTERLSQLDSTQFGKYKEALQNSPNIADNKNYFSQDTVTIGEYTLKEEEYRALKESLEVFIPWKKGPFSIHGIKIDSEWKSNLKWDRLRPHIGSLENQVVADVGCHNGYFMFRMASDKPKAVIGFEPVVKHWYNFHLLNKYANQENLFFELFGVEHMDLFPASFDSIFCLGILYHHTDPIGLLKKMRSSLKKGGQLIIDCQGIPGEEPVALVPQGKYTGARGFWFLPTLSCLQNWVKRAGFQHIDVLFTEKLSIDEQRSTPWAPIKSLKDFISPCGTKTIEGHPAPYRFYLKAKV